MYHRGISTPEQQKEWLKADWDDMYDWRDLDDMNKMQEACYALAEVIKNNGRVQVLTDCDCDGYTSAAIILNYLFSRLPEWSEHKCSFLLHKSKQHGLSDVMDKIDCDLIIVPDAASNDWQQQMELTVNRGIEVIVLDFYC